MMRNVTPIQLETRVEAVLEVVREITGQPDVSDAIKNKLQTLSYEDLGRLAWEMVNTRSVNHVLRWKS